MTQLQQANRAFQAKNYEQALELYLMLQQSSPFLGTLLDFNIALTRKRLTENQSFSESNSSQHRLPVQKMKLADSQEIPQEAPSQDDYIDMVKKEIFTVADLLCEVNLIKLTGKSKWRSVNEDPHFYLTQEKVSQLKPGYYFLKAGLQLEEENHRVKSKLYLDYGNGFNEEDVIALNLNSGKTIGRVIHIKKQLTQLRFDPKELAGTFELLQFSISHLDLEKLEDFMFDQLIEHDIDAKDLKSGDLNALYAAYDQTFNVSSHSINYQDWIRLVETPGLPTSQQVSQTIKHFKTKPVISVVMPTYNTDDKFLRLCIDSVVNQTYPHWELCIADDKSPNKQVKKTLQEYAKKDQRIKVVFRKENGHISKATNSAIEVATGDYIALLDHDDALAKDALFFMAEAIDKNPDAKILYSDEDKIDTKENRSDPHFKSDWNPDLFYSQNYVSHLGVYKTEIIKKIGGFRAAVEGSQDQDLLLRCLPYVTNQQIVHIPKVLYHWRMIEGSTALASGEKSYTTEAGIKALQDHFNENGPKGVTVQQGLVSNTYKVNWPIPNNAPKVSLLIPTRDRKQITEVAVRSILEKTNYPNYEIVILDNGSVEPETLTFFKQIQKEDKRVSVLSYDHPFNYSAINNYGVEKTNGELVGLINNDIEVINAEWLTEMVQHAIRPDIGCVGAKLYYPNDLIQHAGVILGIGGVGGHSHKMYPRNHHGYFSRLLLPQNLSAVTAAALIVRRDVFGTVKGLNEQDLQVAFNDVDFCLKVREAGYRNLWTPYAELYHYESISRGHEDTPEKQARFSKEVDYMKETWGNALVKDPYYSPNLTKDREDFSIGSI